MRALVIVTGHVIYNLAYTYKFPVHNHVKLMHVINSRRGSLRALYCVVDTSYGLGRSLVDCRPGLSKGRKYQMDKNIN